MNRLFFQVLNCCIDEFNLLTFRIYVFLLDQTLKNAWFAKLIVKSILLFLMFLHKLSWIIHFLEGHMSTRFFRALSWFWRSLGLNLFSRILMSLFFFFHRLFSCFWITRWIVFNDFQNVIFEKRFYLFVSFNIVLLEFMDPQRVNYLFVIQVFNHMIRVEKFHLFQRFWKFV